MDKLLEQVLETGILPVIKVPNEQLAAPLAGALWDGGMTAIEVTLRNEAALRSLAAIREAKPEMIIAAGTVRSVAQMQEALAAGAQVIVAPGLNEAVAEACLAQGVPYVPACVTGTELERGLGLGLTVFKFFPAERMGGVPALELLGGPYPEVRFVPTGGITLGNLSNYLALKNVAACGGRFMADEPLVLGERWEEISANCRVALGKALGFQLAHVGLNHGSSAQALADAQAFSELFMLPIKAGASSIFAGTAVECMNAFGYGAKGHIGFYTSSCERALAYCRRRKISIREESLRYQAGGELGSFYFLEEIGGFAVHVVRK